MLQEEIQKLEDAAYICYEQGFDEALAQVKYFASENLIDLSRVNQERKLYEIQAKEALTNQDAPKVVVGPVIYIGAEEDEEEEGETPVHYLDLS